MFMQVSARGGGYFVYNLIDPAGRRSAPASVSSQIIFRQDYDHHGNP